MMVRGRAPLLTCLFSMGWHLVALALDGMCGHVLGPDPQRAIQGFSLQTSEVWSPVGKTEWLDFGCRFLWLDANRGSFKPWTSSPI